ncbi:MAG: LarC family nickel insertion protein [Planctomycetes bacterium]|nr:LarC family nickel insertion protein [Planctomycetota bacterium]
MNTLYLNIFSGISGDMFLGAMLDLGVEFSQLQAELAKLELTGYHLRSRRESRSGIEGIKFDVLDGESAVAESPEDSAAHFHETSSESHTHGSKGHHHHEHHAHQPGDMQRDDDHGHDHSESRDFAQIRELIGSSRLSSWVQDKSIAIFHRIAVAEGKIHGKPPENVHFHEVGAIDSIVDIVGACAALEMLDKPRVLASPAVDGTGWVRCAHGRFPVPTTATLEILSARRIPLTQCDEPHELITPTGAALLAEFAEHFGPMHGLVADRIGYGLGTRENKTRPNVLRAILSRTSEAAVKG